MQNPSNEERFRRYLKSWGVIPNLFWRSYAARAYCNGTGFALSLNVWHPFTIILLVILLVITIPLCLFSEFSIQGCIKDLWGAVTVESYFKKNPQRLVFINRKEYRRIVKNGR